MALCYRELLSDLFWIRAVLYYGEHSRTDRRYPLLPHLLWLSVWLDPYFEDPYEFGGIVLAWDAGAVDQSIALLREGVENVPRWHPRWWYLPFFLGFDYFWWHRDWMRAARWLEVAARAPGSPRYLPLLVARLYARAGSPQVAVRFLEETIRRAPPGPLRERLRRRLERIRRGWRP